MSTSTLQRNLEHRIEGYVSRKYIAASNLTPIEMLQVIADLKEFSTSFSKSTKLECVYDPDEMKDGKTPIFFFFDQVLPHVHVVKEIKDIIRKYGEFVIVN